MSKLAKALYDNTAECADELAFRRGDIVTVVDQNVAGTSGWWMCSLYGRHGLAPANRLKLLPQTGSTAASLSHVAEKPTSPRARSEGNMQNIYQIPSVPRPTSSPAYERMDVIYKAPSAPLSTSRSPIQSTLQHSPDGLEANKLPFVNMATSPKGEVYDVPCQPRRASMFTESTTSKLMPRQTSLSHFSDLEKKFDSPENSTCSSPGNTYVYAVPPPLTQDPNYDVPVPSAAECQQKVMGGYNTLPSPRKPEWIYDVPVGSDQNSYDTLPLKTPGGQLYDTLPVRALPFQRGNPTSLHYDIPKSTPIDISSPPKVTPQAPLYDSPPTPQPSEELIYDVPPKDEPFTQNISEPYGDHKPLEFRGDPSNSLKFKRVYRQRMKDFLPSASFHDLPESGDSVLQEDERGKAPSLSAADNQRISTASNSSSSSCDSLPLSSSSPEPHREVTLSQDEACRRLFDLQECVCKAVPQLMDFVSSNWRCKEHLEKHRVEIKEAAEGIASSLMCFLNFALDVKGNARRLTDANLQSRLNKQLSIVEDSSVILQQTVSALNAAGWPLNVLCQEQGRVQTPDQLDRFVMVARTVPDDVKRLVSIVHANGKLLFKAPKDPESVKTKGPAETKKSPDATKQGGNAVEDDDDYVELQTKEDDRKQEEEQREPKEDVTSTSETADNQTHASDSSDHQPSSLSEHSRLYFGALQKAIGGFVGSLQDGQPPEKFISQSKLVIMVGQRLVDTLCRKAQRGASGQSLLCKSNHLCALLKQLAVATKKAALHFPDTQALREAQEFAKELAQRAQHFRISLEL